MFVRTALQLYDQQIKDFVRRLELQIDKLSAQEKPVNVSDWFYWLSFDVMGSFAFARSFQMLEDKEWHPAIRMLRSAMRMYAVHRLRMHKLKALLSDTVAPTLVYLFYELAKRPKEALKLFSELQSTDVSDQKQLRTLPHLTGFINETLRLHPPVPTGGYRQTPPEGIYIDGQFIPGGITIVAPRYTIGRYPTTVITDVTVPGRYSCVGKHLALSEIRSVVATLVSRFDISFALGENGSRVDNDTQDQFTANPGRLILAFRRRTPEVMHHQRSDTTLG
ncbi:MAG: hypothetical protein Q9219_006135 [cf. Caloplaca sp. 3 TL-2023]